MSKPKNMINSSNDEREEVVCDLSHKPIADNRTE